MFVQLLFYPIFFFSFIFCLTLTASVSSNENNARDLEKLHVNVQQQSVQRHPRFLSTRWGGEEPQYKDPYWPPVNDNRPATNEQTSVSTIIPVHEAVKQGINSLFQDKFNSFKLRAQCFFRRIYEQRELIMNLALLYCLIGVRYVYFRQRQLECFLPKQDEQRSKCCHRHMSKNEV